MVTGKPVMEAERLKPQLLALLVGMFGVATCLGQTQAGTANSVSKKHTCVVDRSEASEAAKALANGDDEKALNLFATMTRTDPTQGTAGTIRTLLAQQKVAEALTRATDWVAAEPESATALLVLAEASYRWGDFPKMSQSLASAQKLDPCNARIFLLGARIQRLEGNLKTAKELAETAHKLAPNEPEVLNFWVHSLLPVAGRGASHECEPTTPIATAQVPLKEIMDGPSQRVGIALDVLFNGKIRRLQVDTGASGLVLSRGAAQGLGLVREGGGKSDGVGDDGLAGFSSAHVASIKIGGLEFRNCEVEFLEQRSRLDVDGLIGADVFRDYLLTLNFPDLKMQIDPLPKLPETAEASGADPDHANALHDRYIAPEMKDWTRVYSVGHEILVPTGLTSKKGGFKDKLFLLDTGAGLNSISPEAAREVTKVYGDDSVEVHGIAGKVDKTFSTSDFDLIFGRLKLPVYEMMAFDTSRISRSAGVEVSGFLGAPVLFRLTLRIDYRDRLVQFVYDAKKDPVNRLDTRY